MKKDDFSGHESSFHHAGRALLGTERRFVDETVLAGLYR